MRLIMAGIIQDRGYFQAEVEPYIDGHRVEYLGSVGPGRREALLAGAYALLHLINFREPFGLSMVESMACGTPVIARPLGSVPEIVVDGRTGFHVSTIRDAVTALARVPEINRAICRAWVTESFHVSRMVSDYIDVYKTILGFSRTGEKAGA